MIPGLSLDSVKEVIESTRKKISVGLRKEEKQTFLHTGPHHDDIMLGIFPCIIPQLRVSSNKFHFAVLTSGFTAVTNDLLRHLLEATLNLIRIGKVEMLRYPDFFEKGYKYKFDKDVSHYLNKIAANDEEGKLRGICHRMTRMVVQQYKLKSEEELIARLEKNIELLRTSYSGEKNPPDIQKPREMRGNMKRSQRAHYGVKVEDIEHPQTGILHRRYLYSPAREKQGCDAHTEDAQEDPAHCDKPCLRSRRLRPRHALQGPSGNS